MNANGWHYTEGEKTFGRVDLTYGVPANTSISRQRDWDRRRTPCPARTSPRRTIGTARCALRNIDEVRAGA
jgi:hypothetical protein